MTNLLDKIGLVVEYSKTEVFHFSRSHSPFNPPLLCYKSKSLGLNSEVTLYRVYTRELNGELCTE